MALTIKDPETDRLARELARRTGETLTEAVRNSLRERIRRELARKPVGLREQLLEISRRASALPRQTGRSPDEIIGYDSRGLPE